MEACGQIVQATQQMLRKPQVTPLHQLAALQGSMKHTYVVVALHG